MKSNPKTVISYSRIVLTLLTVFLTSSAVLAEEPVPHDPLAAQMIKNADDLLRGETMYGKTEMIIETPRWTRHRFFYQWNVGYEKTYVRIYDPDIEKGTGSLRIGFNFWHYVAKAERTIKLSPSLMLQPWIGSDFTNDDLVKMSSISRDYYQKIEGDETADGLLLKRIKLTPRPEAPVVWGALKVWLREKDCIPVKVEYYDEDGELVRILEYTEVKHMDDREIPTVYTMRWLKDPGKKTVLILHEAKFNRPIGDEIFTIENLEKKGEEF